MNTDAVFSKRGCGFPGSDSIPRSITRGRTHLTSSTRLFISLSSLWFSCSNYTPTHNNKTQTIQPRQGLKKKGKITSNDLLNECGCVCFGDIKFALRGHPHSHGLMSHTINTNDDMEVKKNGDTPSGSPPERARLLLGPPPKGWRWRPEPLTHFSLFNRKQRPWKRLAYPLLPTHVTQSP